MPGLPLEDLVHITFGGPLSTERWQTGAWFKLTGVGTPTPVDFTTPLNSINSATGLLWSTAIKAGCSSGTNLDFVKLTMYRNNVLYFVGQQSISAAAGSGTSPLPGYVAQVWTLKSNLPTRSGRGRMYVPKNGLAVSGTTYQWPTVSTALAALKTWANSCETALSGLPGTTPSAKLSVVGRSGPPSQPVTLLQADSIPDVQHGRTKRFSAVVVDQQSY
jgi:hypothetical protein